MNDGDWAFVFGVSQYAEYPPLEGPVNDAEAFIAWLTDPERGAIPPGQIHRFTTPTAFDANDPEPTRTQFLRVFASLVAKKSQTLGEPVGRRAYFYFAGHGATPGTKGSEVAFLMAPSMRSFIDSIPGKALVDYCERAGMFEEIVTIMDCCRDDKSAFQSSLDGLKEIKDRLANPVKRFDAFATQAGAVSREGSIDGVSRGYFTTALVEALHSATPVNGSVHPADLAAFIYSRMASLLPAGKYQEPDIPVYTGQRELLFPTKPDAAGPRIVLQPSAARAGHTITVSDGALTVIYTGAAGTDPVTVPVTRVPGLYLVRDQQTGDEQYVKLVEGCLDVTF